MFYTPRTINWSKISEKPLALPTHSFVHWDFSNGAPHSLKTIPVSFLNSDFQIQTLIKIDDTFYASAYNMTNDKGYIFKFHLDQNEDIILDTQKEVTIVEDSVTYAVPTAMLYLDGYIYYVLSTDPFTEMYIYRIDTDLNTPEFIKHENSFSCIGMVYYKGKIYGHSSVAEGNIIYVMDTSFNLIDQFELPYGDEIFVLSGHGDMTVYQNKLLYTAYGALYYVLIDPETWEIEARPAKWHTNKWFEWDGKHLWMSLGDGAYTYLVKADSSVLLGDGIYLAQFHPVETTSKNLIFDSNGLCPVSDYARIFVPYQAKIFGARFIRLSDTNGEAYIDLFFSLGYVHLIFDSTDVLVKQGNTTTSIQSITWDIGTPLDASIDLYRNLLHVTVGGSTYSIDLDDVLTLRNTEEQVTLPRYFISVPAGASIKYAFIQY
ncbi:MAG TPA: hypothetical protein ENF81_05775 [Thermotogaceae bacterium]|nr:hypothetical protein [Thermotogaceae bacterium]